MELFLLQRYTNSKKNAIFFFIIYFHEYVNCYKSQSNIVRVTYSWSITTNP